MKNNADSDHRYAAVIPTDVREGELDGDQERSYGHDRARSRAISGYVALARYTHKLNGRQILTTLPEASGPNGQNTATVALDVGTNVLILKIINKRRMWRRSLALTDQGGRPVREIQTHSTMK